MWVAMVIALLDKPLKYHRMKEENLRRLDGITLGGL